MIEHLDNPENALGELRGALDTDGILILGCPNRSSLKGLITWLKPVGFHRWYYKTIVGKKDRGEGHFDVFDTPFRKIVSRHGLTRWLKSNGMKPLYFQSYDGAKAFGITSGSSKKVLLSLPYYVVGWENY